MFTFRVSLTIKMERCNGELRDGEKVMRSLKTVDTPIIKGMQIHHNFLRPHTALDGKTPAEIAGIQIEGEIKRGLLGNPTLAKGFFVIAISQSFQKRRHSKASA
jgi:hypothetical protein